MCVVHYARTLYIRLLSLVTRHLFSFSSLFTSPIKCTSKMPCICCCKRTNLHHITACSMRDYCGHTWRNLMQKINKSRERKTYTFAEDNIQSGFEEWPIIYEMVGNIPTRTQCNILKALVTSIGRKKVPRRHFELVSINSNSNIEFFFFFSWKSYHVKIRIKCSISFVNFHRWSVNRWPFQSWCASWYY